MSKSQTQYLADFGPETKRKRALAQALDIRKFEIDMYWKRATYFWTLIAATLAGYAAVQAGEKIAEREFLSVVLASLGLLFAVAWHCVNRGSKQWQENWENHVDMLEDNVIGPLYKTVLRRRKPINWKERCSYFLTGPGTFSVSGINQIISLYVVALWATLLWRALPTFGTDRSIHWLYLFVVGSSIGACAAFFLIGRTYVGDHKNIAVTRTAAIDPP